MSRAILFVILFTNVVLAESGMPIPRCEVVPLPGHRVSLRVDGLERIGWHFGAEYERPFFFPVKGPSGTPLTRMGHPGAENHDHHRSIWFAHNDVEGENFWANSSPSRIRQKHWYQFLDGENRALMAVRLGWFNGEGVEVMELQSSEGGI